MCETLRLHSTGDFGLFGSTSTPDYGIGEPLEGLLSVLDRENQSSQQKVLRLDLCICGRFLVSSLL